MSTFSTEKTVETRFKTEKIQTFQQCFQQKIPKSQANGIKNGFLRLKTEWKM